MVKRISTELRIERLVKRHRGALIWPDFRAFYRASSGTSHPYGDFLLVAENLRFNALSSHSLVRHSCPPSVTLTDGHTSQES